GGLPQTGCHPDGPEDAEPRRHRGHPPSAGRAPPDQDPDPHHLRDGQLCPAGTTCRRERLCAQRRPDRLGSFQHPRRDFRRARDGQRSRRPPTTNGDVAEVLWIQAPQFGSSLGAKSPSPSEKSPTNLWGRAGGVFVAVPSAGKGRVRAAVASYTYIYRMLFPIPSRQLPRQQSYFDRRTMGLTQGGGNDGEV